MELVQVMRASDYLGSIPNAVDGKLLGLYFIEIIIIPTSSGKAMEYSNT
jgi:hypothetical protein